ncbi:MAG: hypothetical protein AAGH15_25370, partial [Myxococcota bacterium]
MAHSAGTDMADGRRAAGSSTSSGTSTAPEGCSPATVSGGAFEGIPTEDGEDAKTSTPERLKANIAAPSAKRVART